MNIKTMKQHQFVSNSLIILANSMESSVISRFHVRVASMVLFVNKLLTVL